MIVLDTSVYVDALIRFDAERSRRSLRVIDVVSRRNLPVYAPMLLVVELSGVLARYRPERAASHVAEITRFVNLVGYDTLHEEAVEVALRTGCRAADAFFIACARVTGSILATCDRIQAVNARRAGVEAYYLLDDGEYRRLTARLESV
ncbi:PilT protein domain protein [Pyrolobus fumarii 1A]|uniref:PilT protein domain protein n=1 Tax=Pyrolobus fumarii (strain DSM 11204 / 1A) TaxID=694429 RepID=G0EFN3_PYRF1|nr:type II toxin-antitoxin system VapC family toxin [Pyrolobus fumarii]AEM38204.1 PilT protein domain protein [Pyrolobus fumarii 1A]